MNRRLRRSRSLVAILAPLSAAALHATACNDTRTVYQTAPTTFDTDASASSDTCGLRCSLDGRSVVDSCSGAVAETCAPELACGAGRCLEPCAAAAADSSSNGCDFYLQPPVSRFAEDPIGCFAAYVVNTSTLPATVSLEFRGEPIDLSKSIFTARPDDPANVHPHSGPIAPGESVIVYVADQDRTKGGNVSATAPACPEGVVPAVFDTALVRPKRSGRSASFHLTTDVPVALSSIYPAAGGASFITTATLLLPTPTWGKENMIVNAWTKITNGFAFSGAGPSAQIVAAEDDTEVTIHPSEAIQDGDGLAGTAAGVPAKYRLAKGEVLQLNQAEELTGSLVISNKPTAVFGGHECMFIPSDVWACDYAQQQLPALAQWGTEYAAAGYRPRLGDESEAMPYRIIAARDGTRLDYDPPVPPKGAPVELAAGEVVTFHGGAGEPFVVRSQDAEHPIYLAGYMTGGTDFHGEGDPEFVNVVPSQQYQNAYSFYADPTYAETAITLIRRKTGGAFRDVWLECAGTLSDWKPIGTRGEYEWRRVDLVRKRGAGETFGDRTCTAGIQRMRSEGELTATLWGWDAYTSYAYPGGTALRKLTTQSFDPVR